MKMIINTDLNTEFLIFNYIIINNTFKEIFSISHTQIKIYFNATIKLF